MRGARGILYGALVTTVGAHLLRWNSHVDDAGIVYAYARNLGRGHGLVARPGEVPLEAFSDPLWVALLTPWAALGLPVPLAAEVLELLLGVLAVLLGAGLAREVRGVGDAGAVAAGWAIALCGVWFAWSSAGLEGALLGVILLGAAWTGAVGPGWGALLLVALAAWTRPEGALAGVAAVASGALVGERRDTALWALAGAVLGLGSLHGVRLAWLGTWVPHSVAVKGVATGRSGLRAGLEYAAWSALLGGVPWLVPAWRGRRGLAGALVIATGLGLAVLSGGDWMRHGRFLAPYLPLAMAWLVPVLVDLARRRAVGGVALLGLLVTGVAVGVDAWLRPTVPMVHGTRRGALYRAVGEARCGRASVATPDVGGVLVGWPEVEVLDLAGLVDAEVGREPWASRIGRERPVVVDLHDGWAARTGLGDAVLDDLGYEVLCRRGERTEAPTLWVDGACGGGDPAQAAEADALVDAWCRWGSGRDWASLEGATLGP